MCVCVCVCVCVYVYMCIYIYKCICICISRSRSRSIYLSIYLDIYTVLYTRTQVRVLEHAPKPTLLDSLSNIAGVVVRGAPPRLNDSVIWPLHDIAITNIVWCMP